MTIHQEPQSLASRLLYILPLLELDHYREGCSSDLDPVLGLSTLNLRLKGFRTLFAHGFGAMTRLNSHCRYEHLDLPSMLRFSPFNLHHAGRHNAQFGMSRHHHTYPPRIDELQLDAKCNPVSVSQSNHSIGRKASLEQVFTIGSPFSVRYVPGSICYALSQTTMF